MSFVYYILVRTAMYKNSVRSTTLGAASD